MGAALISGFKGINEKARKPGTVIMLTLQDMEIFMWNMSKICVACKHE